MFLLGIPPELDLRLPNFLDGELRRIQGARDLRVQIPPNETAKCNHRHEPKRNPGNASKLKRRMERNHKRRGGAQNDVEIEPVPGIALPAKPSPAFAQRIEKNYKKH